MCLRVASVCVAIALLLGISTGCQPERQVPDVVGLTQAAAETAIGEVGLSLGNVATEFNETVPEGSVVRQEPPAGSSVTPGTAVDLVVSLGPADPGEQVSVPNVIGLTQAAAETMLTDAGLVLGTVTLQEDGNAAPGTVLGQDPAAGQTVGMGSTVDLVVSTDSGSANLTVVVVFNEPQFRAGPGVRISANGEEVATTNANGEAQLALPAAGRYVIEAFMPFMAGGEIVVDLQVGDNGESVIVMMGEGLIREGSVRVPDAKAGVLPSNQDPLELEVADENGNFVPLSDLDAVLIGNHGTAEFAIATEMFDLTAEGRVRAKDAPALYNLIADLEFPLFFITVEGEESSGHVRYANADFLLGGFELVGMLKPSADASDLPLEGVKVEVEVLGSELRYETVTGPGGSFALSGLPGGVCALNAKVEVGGIHYIAFGLFSLATDTELDLKLLSPGEVQAGESSISVISSEGKRKAPERHTARVAPAEESMDEQCEASVYVVAGAVEEDILEVDTVELPVGTQRVTLKYEVRTDEYPTYVLEESVYDDRWFVMVTGSNGVVFSQTFRVVNAQVDLPPTWQTDGTTGLVVEELDVSQWTTEPGFSLVLRGSVANVGDDDYHTYVQARLCLDEPLEITSIEADSPEETENYYSIPDLGESNLLQRTFTLGINRPEGVALTRVEAELVRADSGELMMTLVNEGPGLRVEEVDDETLRVQVTLGEGQVSSVSAVPPPLHNIMYRFTLEGVRDGNTLTSQPKEGPRSKALWRLPEDIVGERYSTRDVGGDDWASRGTYEWLEIHRAKVPAINDISGEHGRNIGHQSHKRGTDIDAYHFRNLREPGESLWGMGNYQKLVELTKAALGGDTSARNRVRTFVTESRDGYSVLAALGNVRNLITPKGAPDGNLPNGWVWTLMRTGSLTDNDGATLNLGIGAWESPPRVRNNNAHNDHIHITLETTIIADAP